MNRLPVLHGLTWATSDANGRAELLTASYEGIHRFGLEGGLADRAWRRTHIAPGARPQATSRVGEGFKRSGAPETGRRIVGHGGPSSPGMVTRWSFYVLPQRRVSGRGMSSMRR